VPFVSVSRTHVFAITTVNYRNGANPSEGRWPRAAKELQPRVGSVPLATRVMATEQDTDTDLALRPQTPAARRRNPAANARTAEERDRLREESRARRRARADGQVVAPDPQPHEIRISRLTPEAPPASPLKPSTPAGGAIKPEALREEPAREALREESLREPAPQAPPPSWPPFKRPVPEEPLEESPADELAEEPLTEEPLADDAADEFAPDPFADEVDEEPPARAKLAPPTPRDRATALLALASAVGVVVAIAASLGSGGLPGFGSDFQATTTQSAVAPGGWLTLHGKDAPDGAQVLLESRTGRAAWHPFAKATAGDDGKFVVRGRVLQRPGQIEARVRVLGGAATKPVALAVRPLRMLAVGDINLDGAPGNAWQSSGRALRKADLAFGNLESAVSTGGVAFPKEYNFRASPAALATLRKRSGIDVLNLANNHVGDFGPQATIDTVRRVERLGMKAVGAGSDLKRALTPQVVNRLGLRIAFVGFSEIAPIEFAATRGQPGTAWANPSEIARAVQAARRKADIVVATFHWGIEKQTLETAQQRALADVAVRNGAQVVIGAHPHTLQPVRRQGAAIVAYSLGNFVFDAVSPQTTTTGMLELDLTAEGVAKAKWRSARISGGRPVLDRSKPRRLPLRDNLRMQAGVNLPEL
jgi:poly-gamma-glutamate capsule biosynthesis protein CapA/YwtB (metallophosphatase superfamily)